MKKKFLLGILFVPAVVFLVHAGLTYFYPISVFETKTRLKLSWNGIEYQQFGPLWGYERNTCDSDKRGCTCIALIHGLGDSALTWRKLLMEKQSPEGEWRLPVRLVALDLPGVGDSKEPEASEGFRARLQAQSVREALEGECSTWMVVGNSLGGWIGVWLALDWKGGVQKLVLLNPAGLRPLSQETLWSQVDEKALQEFQKRAYHNPRSYSSRFWKQAVDRLKASPVEKVRRAQTKDDFLDGKLNLVRAATMVLWGMDDRVLPEAYAREVASEIPQGIFRRIEKCGHLPQKECPFVVFKSIHEMIRFGAM